MKKISFLTRLRFSYTAFLLDAARLVLQKRLSGNVRSTGNFHVARPALAQSNARANALEAVPLKAAR
ncbi:hypothetical protein [Terriglobus aquaticus]|uniref:Uncharacterized protein n=1 Tax=Terriglobus aquaticus TaxID=940139 RepID=A0ABW9KIK4_9BACT|nr:hypothetical protein [Terriglobus aquaticus]